MMSVCLHVQAVQLQATVLRSLASGGALQDLYSTVLKEPDMTTDELVDYSAYLAGADLVPPYCDRWDTASKPPWNPAQFLGLTFEASIQQVSLACSMSVGTVSSRRLRRRWDLHPESKLSIELCI